MKHLLPIAIVGAVAVAAGALAVWWTAAEPRPGTEAGPTFLWAVSAEAEGTPFRPLPQEINLDEKIVRLGERLFHDVRLSRDETISCASCHDLAQGGADGRAHVKVDGLGVFSNRHATCVRYTPSGT
jgi:cytochrome c peroxidase